MIEEFYKLLSLIRTAFRNLLEHKVERNPHIDFVIIKNESYDILNIDSIIVFTSTATGNLPPATGSAKTYRIICRNGTCTISGNGTDTIKGETSQQLFAGEDLIISDVDIGKWE